MFQYNSYHLHFIIHLTQPIDLFEDLLPICIENRHMLSFHKNDPTKICVLKINDYTNPHLTRLTSAMNELDNNECYYTNDFSILRKKFPDLFLYYDVFTYSSKIKGRDTNYHDMMKDNDYFMKVVEIESNITNYSLTEEDTNLINAILNKLPGIVQTSGLEIVLT